MLGHGRTTYIHSDCLGRAHGPAVHLLYALALFLLLAVDSWAQEQALPSSCVEGSYTDINITRQESATRGNCSASGYELGASCRMYSGKVLNERIERNGYVYMRFQWSEWYSRMGSNELCRGSGMSSTTCLGGSVKMNNVYISTLRCGNDCDAEKADCQLQGGIWVDSVGYGECDGYCQKIDTTLCEPFRQQCERAGGQFSGSSNTGCCIATCNQCDSLTKLINLKQQICCDQGLAPPDSARMCFVLPQSECGMGWSQIKTNDNEFKCQSPSADSSASRRYAEQCFASSSSEGGSSSSEGSSSSSDWGSSSSGGGGSSSGQGGDCEECPWLDSILDTLHSIHGTIDNLYYCMITPGLCWEDQSFQFDTAWLRYIRPFLDTSLALDSAQLRELVSLDTNILRQLRQNEEDMERVVRAGVSTLDSTTDALNDTTRKWFRRIADSIGVSTDSLAALIDSIIRHIPDTILDSIAKYQRYVTDNFDSILYGKGKGFSLVDSLIDSAVKYFKDSHHYDSVYRKLFADSTSKLITTVDGLPGQIADWIDENMGYGDTASTNLRGDLNGIREAIEGLGDGLGEGIVGALDSSIRSGYGNGADTSGVSYGWIEHGEALGDSILEGIGFSIDGTSDSLLMDSLMGVGYVCNDDSCCQGSQCVYFDSDSLIEDSLRRHISRLGDSIDALNEAYLKDSTTSLFQEVKDSLKSFNPLGIFDSAIVSTLGAKIPNTNTCPEHCSKFEVDIPFSFGTRHFTIDYGLCLGRLPFGNGNVLSFLRFIIRLVVAVTCIMAVMWNAARIKR